MNTRPFLKNRKISSRRKPANAERLLLVLLTAFLLPGSAIAFASGNTVTKPAPRPVLKGAIDTDTTNVATPNKKTEEKPAREPDFAYGAFQRGLYLTAFELALPRAESGDPVAQTLIAELFWKGLGVARDRKKAVDWYKFAAEGGDRAAQ